MSKETTFEHAKYMEPWTYAGSAAPALGYVMDSDEAVVCKVWCDNNRGLLNIGRIAACANACVGAEDLQPGELAKLRGESARLRDQYRLSEAVLAHERKQAQDAIAILSADLDRAAERVDALEADRNEALTAAAFMWQAERADLIKVLDLCVKAIKCPAGFVAEIMQMDAITQAQDVLSKTRGGEW